MTDESRGMDVAGRLRDCAEKAEAALDAAEQANAHEESDLVAELEQRLDAVERERDEERRNRLGGVYWQQLMDDLAAARSRIAALEEGLTNLCESVGDFKTAYTGEEGWRIIPDMLAAMEEELPRARALLAEPSTTREPEPCGVCGKPCDPDWLWCTNCGTARDTDAPAEEGT